MSIYVMISYDIIPFILHAPWFIAGYLDLVIQPTVERAAPKGTIRVVSSLKFIVFRVQQFDSHVSPVWSTSMMCGQLCMDIYLHDVSNYLVCEFVMV